MWRRTPVQHRSQASLRTCTPPPCPVWTALWTRGMALGQTPAMGIKVCPSLLEQRTHRCWSLSKIYSLLHGKYTIFFTCVCVRATTLNTLCVLALHFFLLNADSRKHLSNTGRPPLDLLMSKCSIQSLSLELRSIWSKPHNKVVHWKKAPLSYFFSKLSTEMDWRVLKCLRD